ncbi:hypothetical protein [Cohaesibacter haloalkalitolerans]|uniref:hypothetical protein n=1 Tax=Cohaesibacter haloalkalitolerans TaxID=1162980 RepID=UPI000E647F93|nr:hypothetical protein [Cohaesibacter haloalkalitolerans]
MRFLFLLSAFLICQPAFASDLPHYDSQGYCTAYATGPDGQISKDIYDPCLTSEYFAQAQLEDRWSEISGTTRQLCDKAARSDRNDRSGSGSYGLFKSCIEKQERQAKDLPKPSN